MSNPPPRTPANLLSGLVSWIIRVLDTHSMYGPFPRTLAQLIGGRLLAITYLFRRIAEQVAAGSYRPRRPFTRLPSANRKPRAKSPLPDQAGWLPKLLPELAMQAGNLCALLQNPEMAAVLAAAPGPLRRPFRSLCHMLGVQPPPVLALPPRPRPARAEPAARPRKSPQDRPPRTRLGFYKGPPPFPGRAPDRKRTEKTG